MSALRVITASAGTGKTHRLVRLVVEALVDPVDPISPEGLVAVTYTRAAADELCGRLRAALADEGRADLAGRLRDGRIGTLHSACGGWIRRHALAVGLPPDLAPLPPSEAIRLGQEVLDDALSTVDPEMDALAGRLSQPEWRSLVARILALARANGIAADQLRRSASLSRERLGACFVAGRPDRAQVLERTLGALVPELEASASGSRAASERSEAARLALRAIRAGQKISWREQLALGKLLSTRGVERGHRELVEALRDHTDAAELLEDMRAFVERAFSIAADAAQAFARRKREARLLDHDDLLAVGLRLLDHPEVSEVLAEELELVVVDEFQDVSPLQLAIVGRLIALAGRGAWVGDEKQAIYSFQGSDPELVRASLARASGAERLSRSYRSRPALVGFCSDLFGAALARHGFSPERVRLSATRVDPPELGPALERWTWPWSKRPGADGATEAPSEARALASGVAALLAEAPPIVERSGGIRPARTLHDPDSARESVVRPARSGDIAVLCRTNAQAERTALALRRRGVRAALALPGLLETEEARMVIAGLSLVLDPGDGVAATTLAWLGDAVDDPEAWLGGRLAEVDGWRRRARAAEVAGLLAPPRPLAFDDLGIVRSVRAASDRIRGLEPTDQLDELIEVLGLHDRALRSPDPGACRANLEALRRVAEEYAQACEARRAPATLPGLLEALRRLAREEGGGLKAAPPGADAVAVTTYHGSKGLEWPIVALSGLDDGPADEVFGLHVEGPEVFDAADPLAGRWLRLWPWPYGAHGPDVALARRAAATPEAARARAREEAERARLLYVGFTRARDRLILAAGERDGHAVWPWIDELRTRDGAPALAVDGQTLIAGGVPHPCRVRAVDPWPAPEGTAPAVERRWWARGGAERRPPAVIRPSEAEGGAATILEVVRLGPPIRESAAVGRRDLLGRAVHGFLAADRPGDPKVRERRAERQLLALGVSEPGLAERLVRAADALWRELDARYPGAERRREWPVLEILPDGRRVRGEADLVVASPQRLAVIDHKSTGGSQRERLEAAAQYVGQLARYAEVLGHALGRPVQDVWLHMPFRGELVRIRLP